VRDGTRQSRDAELTDGPWPNEARPPIDAEPDTSERITLIEFLWTGPTGEQPVILVSREWLQ
jgi:hypothetical protein